MELETNNSNRNQKQEIYPDNKISQRYPLVKIKFLCNIAKVSRSGYYNYLSSASTRKLKEQQDQQDFSIINEAYSFRGYAKGSRSICMRLKHQNIIMNRKKIQRLMRKYDLQCPIRKANPYRKLRKISVAATICENIANQEFPTKLHINYF